jgi:hypothetical protein
MPPIFLNYRVGDEPLSACLVDNHLSGRFGRDTIFRASRSIRPGADFETGLLDGVHGSGVLLAVIGQRWLTITDRAGRRKIDDDGDWVRRELAEAFAHGIKVIPAREQLPDDLAPLTRCQYVRIDHRTIDYDLQRLTDALVELLPGLTPLPRPVEVPARAADALSPAEKALADLVERELEAEIRQRRLAEPRPLDVWWSATDDPDLSGRVDQITEAYRTLLRRRVVVLGEPGAGKSTLGLLLAADLLGNRRPGDPVPVPLALSTWDPRAEHLLTWIGNRLRVNYPDLGRRAAAELAGGRLLPILDGLDEIAPALRPRAIEEINRALPATRPMVLTSRTKEFNQAIDEGDVVTAAAVITLSPVRAADATRYLLDATPPRRRELWSPVFDRVHADPHGTIGTALGTPLTVWLARTLYAVGPADPGALLHQDPVRERLLDELVPTVFRDRPPDPRLPHPSRPWGAERATRWLRLLAGGLGRAGTDGLPWWELHRVLPGRTFTGWTGFALTLFIWPLLAWYTHGWEPLSRLVFTAAGGGFLGFVLAMIIRPGGGFRLPVRVRFRNRVRLRYVLRTGLLIGGPLGAALGLVVHLVFDRSTPLLFGVLGGVLVTLPLAILVSLVGWLLVAITDSAPPESTSPRAALRNDRGAALLSAGCFTAGLGLPFELLSPDPVLPLFLILAVVIVLLHTWGRYRLAATVLAVRGRLPWRLARFLDDAYRLGVLRQVGPVYQFRHRELQERIGAP